MNYEMGWNETKSWLKQGIKYMETRSHELRLKGDASSINEAIRLEGKLDGLRSCQQHMYVSQKLYSKVE